MYFMELVCNGGNKTFLLLCGRAEVEGEVNGCPRQVKKSYKYIYVSKNFKYSYFTHHFKPNSFVTPEKVELFKTNIIFRKEGNESQI